MSSPWGGHWEPSGNSIFHFYCVCFPRHLKSGPCPWCTLPLQWHCFFPLNYPMLNSHDVLLVFMILSSIKLWVLLLLNCIWVYSFMLFWTAVCIWVPIDDVTKSCNFFAFLLFMAIRMLFLHFLNDVCDVIMFWGKITQICRLFN